MQLSPKYFHPNCNVRYPGSCASSVSVLKTLFSRQHFLTCATLIRVWVMEPRACPGEATSSSSVSHRSFTLLSLLGQIRAMYQYVVLRPIPAYTGTLVDLSNCSS